MTVRASFTLRREGVARAGADRLALLEAVDRQGSIMAAAQVCGLSYKGAWDAVRTLNNLFDQPVVIAHPGGRSGGAAALTPSGRAVLTAMRHVQFELDGAAVRLGKVLAAGDAAAADLEAAWRFPMKTSARNVLAGVVLDVNVGAVNGEVTLRIADDIDIVAVITRESVAELDLKVGGRAMALIKSSFVILALGETAPRTSARNTLSGTVERIEEGAVNAEVTVSLGGGKTLVATVTRESAVDLGLTIDAPVWALIKAPHVIVAVD